ncbi:hypothetical protein JRQ81_004999 [Phrynocephalus forsythii]|uniref:Solute carrier family 22 member 7 n=1 Tax=Phrynocephalus forsythii TaxID=171643 RepID=A0A9Q0Y4P0_9SAUR|nr:hypothetical protein JRQ81_004999 [Phrynocephalus forsythii]
MPDCHFKVHKTDSYEKSCHPAFEEHKIIQFSPPVALSPYENTNVSAKMKFEDLLEEAGGFGRFQILTLFLLCLPRVILPLHFLLHNFLAAIPPHHCAIPPQDQLANLSKEEVLLISIPKDPEEAFSSCEMFTEPQFHLLLNSTWRTSGNITAVQRFGRKSMLVVSYGCTLVFGMVSAASVTYSMLAITRTLTGMAICGLSLIVVPLGLEWVDIQHRTVSGIVTSVFWSVGNMLLALIAYLVRDWRWLLLSATLPCAVGLLSTWWLSESARWLLAKGKLKQAHRHLQRCAKMNGREEFAAKLSLEVSQRHPSPELFPTVLRQKGQGFCAFVARLGGSVAPLIFLLDNIWKPLPQVTYSAVAVICGASAFFLPETLNIQLPETIEDTEKQSSEEKKQLHGGASEVLPLRSHHRNDLLSR